MKGLFLFCTLTISIITFAQKQQKRINAHLDSLQKSGALSKDTLGLNGEKIDKEAEYADGPSAWRKHLETSNIMDKPVELGVKDGKYTVWVSFTVNADGTLSDFTAITRFGFALEESVIEAIKKSSSWNPALSNGKAIASRFKYSQLLQFSSE